MKSYLKHQRILTLGFVLLLAGALSAQRSPDKTLLVNSLLKNTARAATLI